MFKKFQALGKAIKSIKPNVPKTETQKKIRDLKINTQKLKAGKAKLDQTIFEFKKGDKFTFPSSKKKTMSNTEKAKLRNEESKKMFKKTMGDNKKIIKKIFKGDK